MRRDDFDPKRWLVYRNQPDSMDQSDAFDGPPLFQFIEKQMELVLGHLLEGFVFQRADLGADFRCDPHGGRKLAAMDHAVPDGRQSGTLGQGGRLRVLEVVQEAPYRFAMSFPGNLLGVLLAVRTRILIVGRRPGPVGQAGSEGPAVGRFHERAF